MPRQTLGELAKVVRSKNAKPFRTTFDVIFNDAETYQRVVNQKVLTPKSIAALYNIDESRITSFFEFPAGLAIKFTFKRGIKQGSLGDTDIYGCGQHAPLLDVEVP
jgi:hypothetical protein